MFFDGFFGDSLFRQFNWLNILVGVWFQFFFALDSHLHHNAMQVLAIPVLNALLLGIQSFEYSLMAATKWCYFGIEEAMVIRQASTNNSNYTIHAPPVCQDTGTRLVYHVTPNLLKNKLPYYQANHYHLQNAYNLCLSTLVIMAVLFIILCYLSFKTYRDYGWSIYRINGADIQKRNVLKIYHVFMLALKLNIYFALCDALPYLIQIIEEWVLLPNFLPANIRKDAQDFKQGGYGGSILFILSSAWCLLSALLFYFVGVFAIRKCNYWLMALLLVVYLAQIFIEGRYCLYMLNVEVSDKMPKVLNDYSTYLGVIIAIEMAFDIVILLLGSWVMYNFKNGLTELVNDMYEYKPWIFKRKPEHLKPKKERFVID